LGLAFQVHDDLLGIWGDESQTGKSAHSDLVNGKKSLPVLFALGHSQDFAQRWNNGGIQPRDVAELVALLDGTGARDFTEAETKRLTTEALDALAHTDPLGEASSALHELAVELVTRQA
jgi:geranylgeranyl diphosphate synthase type I